MTNNEEKPNRSELRRVMGMYDLTPEEAGKIIGKSPATVSQYRSVSGASISDGDLDILKKEIAERYPDATP